MGCVSSSTAVSPGGQTEGSVELRDGKNRPEKHTSLSVTSSGDKKASASDQTAYETELAASLVESGGSKVAYHGLLADKNRISLKRSNSTGNSKVFVKSVHPSDDGNTTKPQSEASSHGATMVSGTAMKMPYTIIVGTSCEAKDVENIVKKVFDVANGTVNGWNPESEISELNRSPPGKSIRVGSELLDLFDVVDRLNVLTEGRFDPTTGTLNVAFENCIKSNARPPLPSEVKHLKYGIGWRKTLERKGAKIARANANTVIDLDGVSKGFIIDQLVSALVTNGYQSCYVDWAGDVRATGSHPSGRPWRSVVLLPPPLPRVFTHWQNGTLKEMLQSEDIGFYANFSFQSSGDGGAIATSGDYFSIQKYGYHHIASAADMTVLKSSQTSVASVCVAAAECAVADAIATAAMTCNTVEEATGLLKRIQSTEPGVISGFCVMTRDPLKFCAPHTYTSNVFVCKLDKHSLTAKTQTAGSGVDSTVSEELMSDSRKRVTRDIAEIHFNNTRVVVDSFMPCSMEPEQLVTFVAPVSFVTGASFDPENDLNKLFGSVLGLQSEGTHPNHKGVRIDMRFRKVVEYGKNALVVAAVETIDLGSTSLIEIQSGDGVLARKTMKLSVARSKFGLLPLVSQTKELFRQIPSVVWVIGTKSADQVELAITATSVTVPHFTESMLCFNIAHSSTFFAGITGLGSRIRGHALSVTQKGLADTFVAQSNLSLDAISALESDSVMTADCTVALVESCQDHIIVLARINNVRSVDTSQPPLLWLQGNYLHM